VFEDIKLLDDRSLREVMRDIQQDELIMAMRGASDELKTKFYRNMSERNSNTIKEELEYMAPAKLSEVEQAQQNIVKIIRRLEAEGKLTISRGAGDVFV
jgi:flagellar motor switch protein FliG